jgi:hypothetical protein
METTTANLNTNTTNMDTKTINPDTNTAPIASERSIFKWDGLSGSTLKIIAMVTMMIDHFAAAVVNGFFYLDIDQQDYQTFLQVYDVMRLIGRVAFPIFCFLLVEGFRHTRNAWKYALRLGIFALISEIPFDLALFNRIIDLNYQNVFFTLLLGLLTIKIMDILWEKYQYTFAGWTASFGAALLGMIAADLLRTDYGGNGVLCIILFYIFRHSRLWQTVGGTIGYVNLLNEPTATFAFIPIAAYNGKRGLKLKYIFYIFYPAHLLLFYIISYLMGARG